MVAALYVDPERGPYAHLDGVEVWGKERDARTYPGPHPVVAHPPCGHWGKFRWNCQQPAEWKDLAPLAVEQVRRWGGVLEHPEGSRLWHECRLPYPGVLPIFDGRWSGWTLEVEQVWWGHGVRKRTWLYMVGVDPHLVTLPEGRHDMKPTHAMGVSYAQGRTLPCLPKPDRHLTPPDFARWLVALAEGVTP